MANYLKEIFDWPGFPALSLSKLLVDPWKLESADPWVPVLPEQKIGIEIEVENIKHNYIYETIPNIWIATADDGSLRNSGVEYITCPHECKYTHTLLTHFFKNLQASADFSARTSIHVHFNVQDLTVEHVEGILLTYLVVENLLYEWVGGNRRQSIFCVPVQETYLVENIYYNFASAYAMQVFNWMKYSGFNMLPIKKKGTIEFRQLYGTRDLQKILTWINLCSCIFKYAKETPIEDIRNAVLSLNTNSEYLYFLHKVFGDLHQELYFPLYQKSMEKGVCYIKQQAFINPFVHELMNKQYKGELYKRLTGKKEESKRKRIYGDVDKLEMAILAPNVENTNNITLDHHNDFWEEPV